MTLKPLRKSLKTVLFSLNKPVLTEFNYMEQMDISLINS